MTKHNTAIEWTHIPGYQGQTWNPVVGCSIVSPGCKNCYAMRVAARLERIGTAPHYQGTTKKVNGNPVWTGKVAQAPQHIFIVLTRRAERMREYMTADPVANVDRAEVIEEKINLKFAWRLPVDKPAWPLANVWLGVSAEDQKRADERIPHLLETPAAVRFLSCEPLLGEVDISSYFPNVYECSDLCGHRQSDVPKLERCYECNREVTKDTEPKFSDGCPFCGGQLDFICPDCNQTIVYHHPDTIGLDWIIAGGESGPGARPMHPDWVRSLRDQCNNADVPFFFKQWGEWMPTTEPDAYLNHLVEYWEGSLCFARIGKARAGRLLDGTMHSAFPKCVEVADA